MTDTDPSNKNSRMKRHAGELTNEASTSKKLQVNKTVGANINAQGNAKVYIDTITVNELIYQLRVPQEPPSGIRLQLADPVPSFCCRDKELQHVNKTFIEQKNNEQYNMVVVCGYGGIGKTEFARKYLQQNQADFDNVVWIYAESFTNMRDSFSMLQDELNGRGYRCSSPQDVYQYFNSDKSIFVFDNAENMQSICSFLPYTHNYSLFFITSQFKTWSPYESFRLDKVNLKSARNIIKAVLDTHKIEISDIQLRTLARKFEPIPLVLQIGTGFVCQEVLELKSIEEEYDIDDIIQTLSSELELVTQKFPPFSRDLYAKSIFAALFRTLEKIRTKQDKKSKFAANILGLCSYLSADKIDKKMIMKLLKLKDEKLFNKSLVTLVQFSLIYISDYIRIHRTVQECIRYYCTVKLNSNKYYLQTLYILLDDKYWMHHRIIIQHSDKNFETFRTFYNENKCSTLYKVLGKSASCKTLEQLLLNIPDLIKNPKFLCEAAAREQVDISQLLVDLATDFNVVDDNGFNALYYACLPSDDRYHNATLWLTWMRVQALIKIGADVNSQNSEENTVIHNLCNLRTEYKENDEYIFEICALMIKVGGDPNIKNNVNKTPADLARERGLTRTLQLLKAARSGNRSILHLVAKCRQFKFLKALIKNKVCQKNEQDDSGQTVFHVLAGLTNQYAADELFEKNLLQRTANLLSEWYVADAHILNNSGETAADVARRCGREKWVDLFNAWTQPGRIVYETAAHYRKIAHFPSFVSSKDTEHIDKPDSTGCTFLHAICDLDIQSDNEKMEIVKLAAYLVLWHGADVHIRNNAGDTAADVARQRGHNLLADFLDTKGTKYELVDVAIKYKKNDLIKYVWWRYFYIPLLPGLGECELLRLLCDYSNPTVTDNELISIIDNLDLLQATQCSTEVIELARGHRREILTDWLQVRASQIGLPNL